MSDFTIGHERSGTSGRYTIEKDGETAELTYTAVSEDLIIAKHTGVPESMRGTGAGRAMLQQMIEDARSQGFRIVPKCPFVDAHRRKNPEWADAFKV